MVLVITLALVFQSSKRGQFIFSSAGRKERKNIHINQLNNKKRVCLFTCHLHDLFLTMTEHNWMSANKAQLKGRDVGFCLNI